MDGSNGSKETARVTAPVASNTPESNRLSVNVFTAPGKTMVGERPKPFGEALGFDSHQPRELVLAHTWRKPRAMS
jgi:hypothetical protein